MQFYYETCIKVGAMQFVGHGKNAFSSCIDAFAALRNSGHQGSPHEASLVTFRYPLH